jgi:DNA helicase-2/ATP-dependent DNA helicase PcrA
VLLNVNYRSTDAIIRTCNKLIAGNSVRYAKAIGGSGREGPAPKLLMSEDIGEEAAKIAAFIRRELSPPGDSPRADLNGFAVIYRTNVQARAFADAFMNQHISFKVKDEMPLIYEQWAAKDMQAYMLLADDRSRGDLLRRIINKPNRYISKATIAAAEKRTTGLLDGLYNDRTLKNWQLMRIEELMFYLNSIAARGAYDSIKYIRQAVGYDDYLKEYADYRGMNPKGLYEVLEELQESAKAYDARVDFLRHMEAALSENKQLRSRKHRSDSEAPGVTLTTMHSAKGLEFGTVFIAGAVEGIVPHERSKTDPEIEEERRLLYVGMTRAKDRLYVSVIKNRYEQAVKPSRFLNLNAGKGNNPNKKGENRK